MTPGQGLLVSTLHSRRILLPRQAALLACDGFRVFSSGLTRPSRMILPRQALVYSSASPILMARQTLRFSPSSGAVNSSMYDLSLAYCSARTLTVIATGTVCSILFAYQSGLYFSLGRFPGARPFNVEMSTAHGGGGGR